MQGVGGAGWQHGIIHEHFILLPQGPSTVLGYSQGGRERSCVPGASTRGISCGKSCTVLGYCVIVTSCWDELFPLCCVIPRGSTLEKEKGQRAASCILFVLRGPGLDEVCVCVFGFGTVNILCVCFW